MKECSTPDGIKLSPNLSEAPSGAPRQSYACGKFSGVVKAGGEDPSYLAASTSIRANAQSGTLFRYADLDNIEVLTGIFAEQTGARSRISSSDSAISTSTSISQQGCDGMDLGTAGPRLHRVDDDMAVTRLWRRPLCRLTTRAQRPDRFAQPQRPCDCHQTTKGMRSRAPKRVAGLHQPSLGQVHRRPTRGAGVSSRLQQLRFNDAPFEKNTPGNLSSKARTLIGAIIREHGHPNLLATSPSLRPQLLCGTFRPAAHFHPVEITEVNSMKALCWHGTNDIRCDNVPDPKIEEAETSSSR